MTTKVVRQVDSAFVLGRILRQWRRRVNGTLLAMTDGMTTVYQLSNLHLKDRNNMRHVCRDFATMADAMSACRRRIESVRRHGLFCTPDGFVCDASDGRYLFQFDILVIVRVS